MKMTIQVITEEQDQLITETITSLERQELSPETLGLNLGEAKQITAGIQQVMTRYQIDEYSIGQRTCKDCKKKLLNKGYHTIKYRTLFGKMSLKSPRLLSCDCHHHEQESFSPLTKLLSERTSPELMYLESKWASLMSYGITSDLLSELLPLKVHHSTVQQNAKNTSATLEQELGEERYMYIEGCPRDWQELAKPQMPLTVGIDGDYIHARDGNNRKAGWFEAIVGKSLQEGNRTKRFGYVTDYEQKPKRKLYEMLKGQGLEMNQAITFLSDGGDTVRELPFYLSPSSEHILDWFHITMRMTVIKQMAKGLGKDEIRVEESLERIKWCIWHGEIYKALSELEALVYSLDGEYGDKQGSKGYKLEKAVDDFYK